MRLAGVLVTPRLERYYIYLPRACTLGGFCGPIGKFQYLEASDWLRLLRANKKIPLMEASYWLSPTRKIGQMLLKSVCAGVFPSVLYTQGEFCGPIGKFHYLEASDWLRLLRTNGSDPVGSASA